MGLIAWISKLFSRTSESAHSAGVSASSSSAQSVGVQELDARALRELLDRSAPVLLDCREPYERGQGFIPESVHIPMNQIPFRLDELDQDEEIVVYCAHGVRSLQAAQFLIRQGFKASHLRGGLEIWVRSGGAVVRN